MSYRYLAITLSVLATACVQRGYYLAATTNSWHPGLTKAELVQRYITGQCGKSDDLLFATKYTCAGFETRAAQKQADGSLVEIGVISMLRPGETAPTDYWLLFRDGVLVQWGQPNDWRAVSARYQIDFNPAPTVSVP